MESNTHSGSAICQLQSRAQVELLDAVDRLRLDGFQGDLNLPQLIVCGDQSSGKSSVLEAISGVRFPASDQFCTRFASELTLRRAPSPHFSVRIQPAPHRTEDDQRYLCDFEPPADLTKPEHFAQAIEAASRYITEMDPNAAFFEDKLVAIVRGPELPPLTLVDLPGLIHASNKEQGDHDIQTVKRLVESYMATPSSIILAVLAADNNFANQIVLQLAKTADPDAHRTLGIITKPDKVDAGSRSEMTCIEYVQNRSTYLDLGWHVLRNRSFETADASAEERNMREAEFFKRPNWNELPDDVVGVITLRDKLSRVLLQTLRKGLPTLLSDIKQRIATCEATLTKLGKPKASELEQRSQLIQISMDLHQLMKAGIEGSYRDVFFDDPSANGGCSRRLRSRLREILEEFADHIRSKGHSYNVVERANELRKAAATSIDFSPASILSAGAPVVVSKAIFLDEIARRIRQNRGLELEGMCPADIVADVFQAQSAPWEQITGFYVGMCSQAVNVFFQQALQHTAVSHVAEAILQYHATEHLETATAKLEEKVRELLKPYKRGHLITVNKWHLLSKVDRARQQRDINDEPNGTANDDASNVGAQEAASNATTPAMIFDYMNAYYEIALNTFTENVANLAVENCLVENLLEVFTPVTVGILDAATVRDLTLEPQTVLRDRDMNQKRLRTLKDILQVCNRHGDRFFGVATQARNTNYAAASLENPGEYAQVEVPVQMANTRTPQSQFGTSVKMPYGHTQPFDPAYQTPPATPEPLLGVRDIRRSERSRSSSRRPLSTTYHSSASSSTEPTSSQNLTSHGEHDDRSPTPSQRLTAVAAEWNDG